MTNRNVFNGKPHVGNLHDGLTRGRALQGIQGRYAWLYISMCALVGLANCAKADNVSAQEHFDAAGNIRSIVVNNPTAQIGTVKTPWMFVRPDGKSGFANDFTTNAISVVSENGIEYYAHVEGENGDRTKVIKFTIDENGIPSTHGDIIDMTTLGEEGSAANMANRKLVGVAGHGTLCFYPTEDYGTSLIYNPMMNATISDEGTGITQKCLASCQDESKVYVLCNVRDNSSGNIKTNTYVKGLTGFNTEIVSTILPSLSDENRVMSYRPNSYPGIFIGDSEGNVKVIRKNRIIELSKVLPGPISDITESHNKVDFFITSTATNAFYNANFGYNAVSIDENSIYNGTKPMVPKTTDGLVRIIDNRHNDGGKLLCVTTKGIHSIDD